MTETVKEVEELMKNSVYRWSLDDSSQLETVESIMKNAMSNVGIEENRFQIISIESPYGNDLGLPALMVGLRVLSGTYSRCSIIKEMMNGLRQELGKKGSTLRKEYSKCFYFKHE